MSRDSKIVRWCAEECYRQKSGELSVTFMFEAWVIARLYAKREKVRKPNIKIIQQLAVIIEPFKNKRGFRTIPVTFGNGGVGIKPDSIKDAMENLVAFGDPNEDPLEYYTSFEKIHPFVDGNGRLGSILFNWADLDNPVHPPEVKW